MTLLCIYIYIHTFINWITFVECYKIYSYLNIWHKWIYKTKGLTNWLKFEFLFLINKLEFIYLFIISNFTSVMCWRLTTVAYINSKTNYISISEYIAVSQSKFSQKAINYI